ncbi:MAG: hypothetical protein KJ634_09500 [Gammaproteobacteria bacterium]|nr:hypothetical protein [Gammaproteobacteria bacterium]MBU1415843.1 hypothetical protein [Gammaproteobacteria bacterium]
MTARRLLFLDSHGLTAYHWQVGGPRAEATFASDPAGLEAFEDYLNQRHASLFYLLADVAEEGFQIEDVPYVHGSDRDEMLKRKLSQFFYGTPLSLAMSLGRAKTGRRDEKFLFAGLTGYAQFEPWLQTIRSTEAQLAGVYSVPFVLASQAGKLVDISKPVLLMTVTRAGLRQTFFDRGHLRFSRLTSMSTGMVGEVATACGAETRKIYQYLAGQRLIARDAPLQTRVLAHPKHFEIIGHRCETNAERQVQMMDLVAEAKKQGLKEVPGDSRSDTLLLHMLAKQTPDVQFAPAVERRPYRLWQTRLAINTVAGGILAASLIYTGMQIFAQAELSNTNGLLQAEVDLGKHRYNNMLKGLPPVSIGYDNLRVLTDRFEMLATRSAGPEPMLVHISKALNKLPAIDLTRLDWWIANQPNDGPTGGKAVTPAAAMQAASAGNGFAVVNLQAQLPVAMAGDHRSQLETVNAFAAMLRRPDIEVQIVTFPFETESGKSIRSTDATGLAGPPRFVLKLAGKL